MPWLFSYGSNSPEQLKQRLGHKVNAIPAYCKGYKRIFVGYSEKWQGGVASLKKAKHTTFGSACEVSANDLEILDRFEGVFSNKYKRKTIDIIMIVDDEEFEARAVVYLATSTTENEPSIEYLKAVAKNVGSFWADVHYTDF